MSIFLDSLHDAKFLNLDRSSESQNYKKNLKDFIQNYDEALLKDLQNIDEQNYHDDIGHRWRYNSASRENNLDENYDIGNSADRRDMQNYDTNKAGKRDLQNYDVDNSLEKDVEKQRSIAQNWKTGRQIQNYETNKTGKQRIQK